MYLSILHHNSGEEYLRPLAPNESLDTQFHAKQWLKSEYGGELRASFSKPGAAIPDGGGEYTVEIRHTKKPNGVCWSCEDFFTESEDY